MRGVVILAVNVGDSPDIIREYFEKERFTFIPIQQKDNEISRAWGVSTYPTNYVVAPDGTIAARMIGFDENALRKALEKIALGK